MILILTSKHRIIKVVILVISTISFCIFTYYRTMALENAEKASIDKEKKVEYSSSEKNNSIKKVNKNEESKINEKEKETSGIKNNDNNSQGKTKNKEVSIKDKEAEVVNQNLAILALPANGRISSFFGYRKVKLNDGTIEAGIHKGIDIAVPLGTKIGAAMKGQVEFAGVQEGYGNVIILKHLGGLETVYGHCSKIEVKNGDIVNTGNEIGKAGSTGRSTGPHIHFEVRYNGTAVDPLKYLNNNSVYNK